MNIKNFIILILLSFNSLFGQNDLSLKLFLGYNFYRFSDLKEFQKDLHSEIDNIYRINSRNVSSFPPYLNFQLRILSKSINFGVENFSSGAFIEYSSSGSRIYYGDFSGELIAEQSIRIYSAGLSFEKNVFIGNDIKLNLGVNIPISYTTLNNILSVRNNKDEALYESFTLGFEPFVGSYYYLGNYSIGIEIAYRATSSSDYSLENDDKVILQKADGEDVNNGINGFKIGLLVNIEF